MNGTTFRPKKGENILYDTSINFSKNGGWVRTNVGHANLTEKRFVFESVPDGHGNIYFIEIDLKDIAAIYKKSAFIFSNFKIVDYKGRVFKFYSWHTSKWTEKLTEEVKRAKEESSEKFW